MRRRTTINSITRQPVLADKLVKNQSMVKDIALVVAGAVFIGLLAQVSVPIKPIPVTGQTLGVMLTGAALGSKRAAASVVTYILGGIAGIPWFAGFIGGPAIIAGPTFGYLIGFIFAAYSAGYFAQRKWDRNPVLTVVGMVLSATWSYVFGIPWLMGYMHLAGSDIDLITAFQTGFVPFIPGGIIKTALAAALLPATWKAVDYFDNKEQYPN